MDGHVIGVNLLESVHFHCDEEVRVRFACIVDVIYKDTLARANEHARSSLNVIS